MFHSPWWFLALLLLPWASWRLFSRRRHSSIRFSSTAIADQIAPTLRQRLIWVPKVLTIATLLLLILGLAQPREGREQTSMDSEGIAVEMIVDRSGSMRAMDFKIDGQPVDRLTAVKNVAAKFLLGDDNLNGRLSDLVGLISFAGYADAITPPTLDHSFLIDNLNATEIVNIRSEDGTAIGDAIALAVEKLNMLDKRQSEKVKSKIIILLTDGENTAGELEPLAAAELAQTLGIKVYTIGVGTKGEAPFPQQLFSGRIVLTPVRVNIDEETLKQVAKTTGAKYFRATDTDSLQDIYAEIDKLEKSKVQVEHFVDYRELAVQSYQLPFLELPPVLLLAFCCLVARAILQHTWLREFTD